MPFILSTLSSDVKYTVWKSFDKDTKQPPQQLKSILVKGGANVINKALVTPKGVVTEVSEDEFKSLEKVPSFKRHQERGYISVENKDPKKPDEAAKGLNKDKSAQLTDKEVKSKKKD